MHHRYFRSTNLRCTKLDLIYGSTSFYLKTRTLNRKILIIFLQSGLEYISNNAYWQERSEIRFPSLEKLHSVIDVSHTTPFVEPPSEIA